MIYREILDIYMAIQKENTLVWLEKKKHQNQQLIVIKCSGKDGIWCYYIVYPEKNYSKEKMKISQHLAHSCSNQQRDS